MIAYMTHDTPARGPTQGKESIRAWYMRHAAERPAAWEPIWGPYRERLQAAGASESTIRQRAGQLWQLARAHPDPRALTEQDLLRWLARPHRSAEWRRAYTSMLRKCLASAVAAGVLERDPAAALPPVRVPRRRPTPAEPEQVRRALVEVDDRTRMVVRLGVGCGLRRAEIARINVLSDLLPGQELLVLGKGGRERVVPVPDGLWAELCRARDALGPSAPGWLFPGRTGGHLSPHMIWEILRPTGIRTHQLRSAFATGLADAGLGVFDIADLLGHSSVATTMRYVRPNRERMRRMTQAFAQGLEPPAA